MNRAEYLKATEQIICRDRQDVHGNPEDTHNIIADYWSIYMSTELGIPVTVCAADVAVMMTLFKIARMQVNPAHKDNIIDGIGYLAIAGELTDEAGSPDVLNFA